MQNKKGSDLREQLTTWVKNKNKDPGLKINPISHLNDMEQSAYLRNIPPDKQLECLRDKYPELKDLGDTGNMPRLEYRCITLAKQKPDMIRALIDYANAFKNQTAEWDNANPDKERVIFWLNRTVAKLYQEQKAYGKRIEKKEAAQCG